MKSAAHEIERRWPGLLVASAFLWAPIILTVTVFLTDDPEILIPALIVAGLPYVAVVLWPFVVAIRESEGGTRVAIIVGLVLFAALAIAINWQPVLEYW